MAVTEKAKCWQGLFSFPISATQSSSYFGSQQVGWGVEKAVSSEPYSKRLSALPARLTKPVSELIILRNVIWEMPGRSCGNPLQITPSPYQLIQTNEKEVGPDCSIIHRAVPDFPGKPNYFGKVKIPCNMPTFKGINSESIQILSISSCLFPTLGICKALRP